MPFTPDDAEKHNKGLSKKAQNQWARVAESVRKRLMKKGMSEKEAAGEAVKQANGVVKVNTNAEKGIYGVITYKQTLDYEPKLTVHQDKTHLVIPVVMMVEGVHNGSQGPLLHEISELGKFPASWDGIPVVIYHPEKDGEPVSANSPDIIDTRTVGRVYNTSVEGKKLKAEVWLDEDKLNTISENTLNDINESKEVEVSLGMFTENEMEEGEYEGEKYVGIAHNHRPDHLAILPDQIGACSCADGCGLGANEKNKDMAKLVDVEKTVKQLNIEGFSVHRIGNNTDQGYQEKMQLVNSVLRKLDKDWEDTQGGRHYEYNYLEDMYDDFLIYTKSGNGESKMYKQTYKIESGKIEFVGEPIEVHKKVEYVVNSGWVRNNINTNNKKEDKKMAKNECPKCLEKINAVIANKDSGFIEADREWLETLSETALDKTITPKVKEVEKIVEKTVEVNKLSATDQADLAWAREQRKERRTNWIKSIQENTEKDTWTDVELNEMTDVALSKLHKSVVKEEPKGGNYALNGNVMQSNANTEEILLPTGMKFETKK